MTLDNACEYTYFIFGYCNLTRSRLKEEIISSNIEHIIGQNGMDPLSLFFFPPEFPGNQAGAKKSLMNECLVIVVKFTFFHAFYRILMPLKSQDHIIELERQICFLPGDCRGNDVLTQDENELLLTISYSCISYGAKSSRSIKML